VGAKGFLILAAIVLAIAWSTSGTGFLGRAPAIVRHIISVVFILSAVRLGLSIAILAFDSSPVSYLIPVCFGVAAWWLRPGRGASRTL